MKLLPSFLLFFFPFSCFASDYFEGIGVAINQEANRIYVEQLIDESPVSKEGTIKVGDEILAVNSNDAPNAWVPVADLPLESVIGLIRGAEGTRVGLHLVNNKGQFELFINREKVNFP